jgi:hypothetical protein
LKNTKKAIEVIQATLEIGKRPVLLAKVTRSDEGVCELIVEQEDGKSGCKLDLRATAHFLLSEGGILKTKKKPARPKGGSYLLIVLTSSKKDCRRIEYWGYESELQDLQKGQPVIGNGKFDLNDFDLSPPPSDKKMDVYTNPRFLVTVPRRNPKQFLKAFAKGVNKKAV